MALEQWQLDLMRTVDDKTMADIRSDAKAHNVILSRGGTAKDNQEPPRPNTSQNGWVESPQTKDWRPPGIATIDAMCSAQDAVDRLELVKKLSEAVALQRALKEELEKQEPGK
jgi:hypothetical protein